MEADFTPTNKTLQISAIIGKQHSFELGQHLRQRYDGFLSQSYQSEEVYVRSTSSLRCLASAQACMAGLFPAPEKDMWSARNFWQPVPIHTMPNDIDPCAIRLKGLGHLQFSCSFEWTQFLKDNQKLIEDLTSAKNRPSHPYFDEMFANMCVVESICIEKQLGLPTPHDCGKSEEELNVLKNKMNELFFSKTPVTTTPSAATLEVVLDALANKVNGKTPQLKSFIFFTHDVIIGCILHALTGCFYTPNFVGILIFELHKHPKLDQFYVRMIFKNGLQIDQHDVKVIDHQTLCPFQNFEKIANSFIRHFKF